MPDSFRFPRLPILVLALLLPAVSAHAQRVSAKDRAAVEALDQRMAAAEKRYRDALVLVSNGDPKGTTESDAALQDMEDVIDACAQQRGCQLNTQLAAFKRLLKDNADAQSSDDDEEEVDEPLEDDHVPAAVGGSASAPQALQGAAKLDDKRHAFDRMVQYNPAVQAGIRRWLTDMRSSLVDSYENYQNMRFLMWPQWERQGLPEALLFGIMAKESNGKVHVSSRAGAAGPMQFMYATGTRFGLGRDDTGFDTRFDPRSAAQASAEYMSERFAELGSSVELSLAAYNGGEGRALRVYRQYPGVSFWDERVYNQFPAETRDYVPMVIAAAWLFLHPRQYGLDFPRVAPQPAPLKLTKPTSIYELTLCLGTAGARDGYMRTLRNLNPRYQADSYLAPGLSLNANTRIVTLYNRHCLNGPRAELARTLMAANVNAAIVRAPLPEGRVSVGDVSQLAESAEGMGGAVETRVEKPHTQARPSTKAKPVRTAKVARGDTLGKIANKHGCSLKALAKANGLRAPGYAVRPGQVIKLEGCGK